MVNQIKLVSNFKARNYQQSIFANSLNKNTLVVLPTGLGKTIIAIMQVVYYFNQNPNKKILFLAPTKPLVEQQKTSFEGFFENSDDFNFKVLTGLISPSKRFQIYKENNFIFSTPQLIENDIINSIINPKDFSLVIFDEAHRGTGNYAYCFIAEEFAKNSTKILALTASPGTSMESIREVINNLKIEHVEVKKYSDIDVKPHVKETKVEYLEVELSENFKNIKEKLNLCYIHKLKELKNLGYLQGKTINQISRRDLLDLQIDLRKDISTGNADENIWRCISISAGIMKLSHGIELFESQEILAASNYFYEFFKSSKQKTKAIEELILDIDFREAFDGILELKKQGIIHPKLIKLKEIVSKELLENPDLKLIIFNQYRESAQKIVEELSKINEVSAKKYKNKSETGISRIKPCLFVGQSKKGGQGLSQKKQKELLDDFREGKFNILVSTSVGEEGLDIPKVDSVVFYEPVPSAIRTIQRTGRTGRFKEGKVTVLITKDTRDVIMRHVASAKERKMYQVLDKIRSEFSSENLVKKSEIGSGRKETLTLLNYKNEDKDEVSHIGLNNFIKKKEASNNEQIQENQGNSNENTSKKQEKIQKEEENKSQIDGIDDRVQIYVDNRENNDLIKELFRIEDIKTISKKLDVADIVISEHIAIERKAKADFVNSIIDSRLFPQLKNLILNYRRPVLILEGEENIFSIRNLNPNVIRATLSSIAIDFRIPIIYTNSIEETAQMIRVIARRTIRAKKEISLATNKTSHSIYEEQEKVVSSIPRINVITAKNLLIHFKSIEKLVKAKESDLIKIAGVGKIRAKNLVEFFKREYGS